MKIGIVGDALAPNFNEAYANQILLLSQKLNAPVLTCNNLGFIPLKKTEQYLIVNGRFLREESRIPFLKFLNGAFFYPFLKFFERRFKIILLSGGIDSGFLSELDLSRCVLLINSMPFTSTDKQVEIFAGKFAPKLYGIIAQGRRIRDKLLNMGIEPRKVLLMYPWVDFDKFKYTEPPNLDEFKILFASAPNGEIWGENIFAEKGLPLLLDAFREFARSNKTSLRLLWRGYCVDELAKKLKELDLESQVSVINGVADMPTYYVQSHITVIPFLNTRRSPEIPLSAVESLACGRPVLTTDIVEIAEIIRDCKCGCVVKPSREEFTSALVECVRNYEAYQKNCRKVAERLFSFRSEKLNAL